MGALLLFLIIIPTLVLVLRILLVKRALLNAIADKDPDKVHRILRKKRIIGVFLDKKTKIEALDLLFYNGRFKEFAEIVNTFRVRDDRVFILSEKKALALDIETEVELERKPRELGLSVLNTDEWKEAFRLLISNFNDFMIKYGIQPQDFLRAFLNEFYVIIGHNVYKHDAEILRKWGVDLSDKEFIDTYALSLVALPEARSHSLEFLCSIFGIEYAPHRADEDAFASAVLLQRLTYLLHKKAISLDPLLKFEPVRGLRHLKIPERGELPKIVRRKVKRGHLEVTIDSSEYEDSWYPNEIDLDLLKKVKATSSIDSLAMETISSFLLGGGKDPNRIADLAHKLMKQGHPYESYALSLLSILGKVVRESSLERDALAVDYKHLREFIERCQTTWKIIRFRGGLLLNAYYGEYTKEILRWASRSSKEVIVETLFPSQVNGNIKVVALKPKEKPLIVVENGLDKSPRHREYLGRILAGLFTEEKGRYFVITSSHIEEIFSGRAAALSRVKVAFYTCEDDISLIETVYDMLKMGYNCVLFSLPSIVRKLGLRNVLDSLKYLIEASGLAESKLILLNTESEFVEHPSLSSLVERRKVEQRGDFELKLSLPIFTSMREAIDEVSKTVRKIWGFELRPYQRRCIARMLISYVGAHQLTNPLSIIVLPTGSGKSVIFQSVAMMLREKIGGTTVVISPLLALIRDQINDLRRRGVRVCSISSAAGRELKECLRGFARGEYDLVYITPEQFRKEGVRRIFERADVNYLIIDEIHTVYKWRNFRPSYPYLAQYLRRRREEGFWIPVAGFTATITKDGLREVINMLTGKDLFELEEISFDSDFLGNFDLEEVKVLKGPILRDNIEIDVVKAPSGTERLGLLASTVKNLATWADTVSGDNWVGLIFAGFVRSSRAHENVPDIASHLQSSMGGEILYFHGQMDEKMKRRVLNRLYVGRENVILVATKAFGMGVNIPNIRWVVHYMMPESIEDYYQEIGRGGRDGLPTKALLLYSPGYDLRRRMMLLQMGFVDPTIAVRLYDKLKSAEEGSIIPFLLLVPFLFGISRWKRLIDDINSNRRLPEHMERSIEAALRVLSDVGLLDYDIVDRECIVTDEEYTEYPKYRVSRDLYLVYKTPSVKGYDLSIDEKWKAYLRGL